MPNMHHVEYYALLIPLILIFKSIYQGYNYSHRSCIIKQQEHKQTNKHNAEQIRLQWTDEVIGIQLRGERVKEKIKNNKKRCLSFVKDLYVCLVELSNSLPLAQLRLLSFSYMKKIVWDGSVLWVWSPLGRGVQQVWELPPCSPDILCLGGGVGQKNKSNFWRTFISTHMYVRVQTQAISVGSAHLWCSCIVLKNRLFQTL